MQVLGRSDKKMKNSSSNSVQVEEESKVAESEGIDVSAETEAYLNQESSSFE